MASTFTDGKSNQRIKTTLGKWIIVQYDETASHTFNGANDLIKKTEDGGKPLIYVPDGVVNKQHDINELERVYKVIQKGPDSDSPVEIGDFVLAKGHVQRLFTEPILFAVVAENIVAIVDV